MPQRRFARVEKGSGSLIMKDIYFQNEAWGDVAIQHQGQVHHFSNLMSLIAFLQTYLRCRL